MVSGDEPDEALAEHRFSRPAFFAVNKRPDSPLPDQDPVPHELGHHAVDSQPVHAQLRRQFDFGRQDVAGFPDPLVELIQDEAPDLLVGENGFGHKI